MGCRTCHDIHKTYTGADFSLTGAEKAVKLEYTAGTFDKGAGNLCANCHQIRNPKPEVSRRTDRGRRRGSAPITVSKHQCCSARAAWVRRRQRQPALSERDGLLRELPHGRRVQPHHGCWRPG